MKETPALPGLLSPFQGMMIRAAVSLIPETLQQQLQLEKAARLRGWERLMIRCLGYLGDRIVIKQSPAVKLPASNLIPMSLSLDGSPPLD